MKGWMYLATLLFVVHRSHAQLQNTKPNSEVPPRVHDMRVLDPVPIQNIVGRENLYLECSGSGNPSPKIEWSLNGVRFIPNKLMDGTDPTETNKVRHELGSNSLIIRDVKGSTDSGRYRCIVTNSIGSVFMEKNITIRVMGVFTAGNRFHNVQRKLYPTVGKKFFIECPPHSKGYGNKYRWGVVPRSLSPQYWLAGRSNHLNAICR